MTKPFVVPDTGRRDLLIGLGIGLVLILLIGFGVKNMSSGVAGSTISGKIVAKSFEPLPEEQITIGKGGMRSRKLDGEYTLECEAQGRRYYVTVDKETYMSRKVGDNYFFLRPKK